MVEKLRLLLKPMTLLLVLTVCVSCAGPNEVKILYVRSVQPPEIDGFLRMAQDKAMVNVAGTDTYTEMSGLAGMVLIPELELEALVEKARKQ